MKLFDSRDKLYKIFAEYNNIPVLFCTIFLFSILVNILLKIDILSLIYSLNILLLSIFEDNLKIICNIL